MCSSWQTTWLAYVQRVQVMRRRAISSSRAAGPACKTPAGGRSRDGRVAAAAAAAATAAMAVVAAAEAVAAATAAEAAPRRAGARAGPRSAGGTKNVLSTGSGQLRVLYAIWYLCLAVLSLLWWVL